MSDSCAARCDRNFDAEAFRKRHASARTHQTRPQARLGAEKLPLAKLFPSRVARLCRQAYALPRAARCVDCSDELVTQQVTTR